MLAGTTWPNLFSHDFMAVFLQWEQAARSDRAQVVTPFSGTLLRDCNSCPSQQVGVPFDEHTTSSDGLLGSQFL